MLGNSLQGIGGAIITSPSPGTVPDDVRRCLRKSALMRSCDSRRMSIGAIGPRLFCRSCRSHARLTASSVNPSRCIASKTPSNRDSSAEPSGPKRDASDDSVTLSPACLRLFWPRRTSISSTRSSWVSNAFKGSSSQCNITVQDWRKEQISDERAKLILYAAFVNGELVAPLSAQKVE